MDNAEGFGVANITLTACLIGHLHRRGLLSRDDLKEIFDASFRSAADHLPVDHPGREEVLRIFDQIYQRFSADAASDPTPPAAGPRPS